MVVKSGLRTATPGIFGGVVVFQEDYEWLIGQLTPMTKQGSKRVRRNTQETIAGLRKAQKENKPSIHIGGIF